MSLKDFIDLIKMGSFLVNITWYHMVSHGVSCDNTATSVVFTCNTENQEDSLGCWFFTAREPGVSGERSDMVAVAMGVTGELGEVAVMRVVAGSISVLSSGDLL